MRKLCIALFFIFAAISSTWAQCADFGIFANGNLLGCEASVSTTVMYGDAFTLSIKPEDGDIKWKGSNFILSLNAVFKPIFENDAQILIYTVEREGISKTVIVNLTERSSYTVSFNPNGGSPTPPSQSVLKDSLASKPTETLTKTGYDFEGWDFNFNTPITATTTINAKWKAKTYTVKFETGGGGNVTSQMVSHGETASLPVPPPTKADYDFEHWELNGSPYVFSTPVTAPITLIAVWKPSKAAVTRDMLDYILPANLIYQGAPIEPITVGQKTNVVGTLGSITVLYDGKNSPPADAGIYAVSVSVAESSDYASAEISLGNIAINKKKVTLNINSAVAKNKAYDATTTANITSIDFDATELFQNDVVSANDYSASANFASPNVGTDIAVAVAVNWLSTGPLSKNYTLESPGFTTQANITQALGYLVINVLGKYELSNPVKPSIAAKNAFVENDSITWEYKMIGSANYSKTLPNKVGDWMVRASFNGTENYTGAADSAEFSVERGRDAVVAHKIMFDGSFAQDNDLSGKQRNYFVASQCNLKSATIQITVFESEIILSLGENNPQRGDMDADGFMLYEIPFSFGKPGVDTLFYKLMSKDGIYSERDTILIETPIPFDSVAMQKWNNVLFINNNPLTNGGYEFSDYKWFKNGNWAGEDQFYSAGPSSADTLSAKDIYKVTMHTADGMRISTCEGNPKSKVKTAPKSALKKQVLGINGKTAKSGSKIYNLKGSHVESTPAGIYIVGDKEWRSEN
ncbi:MAG: InlB B-repeat-containing protein [Fibromonadales bacterium]|nr:InlB B-repeat-containing protein [Fibromonadales bacterium]